MADDPRDPHAHLRDAQLNPDRPAREDPIETAMRLRRDREFQSGIGAAQRARETFAGSPRALPSFEEMREMLRDGQPVHPGLGTVLRALVEHVDLLGRAVRELRCVDHEDCRADLGLALECAIQRSRGARNPGIPR